MDNPEEQPPAAPVTERPERQLKPEDQERVDGFLERGVNSVERKPFRPFILLIILALIVGGLSIFSQWIAKAAGVY